jgi:tetraacyldisaccharide 4'-kinase
MWPDLFDALTRDERRGPVAAVARAGLRMAVVPYAAAVRTRNALYDAGWCRAGRAAVPVVCVGNLTVGGTGKTPAVEWVARFLRDRLDRSVCVLSRGYGAAGGPNDEAMVLEENLPDVPHLQGADRLALARTAVEELEADALVLDDGFQHRRLARDLDVVLIDASRPLSREYLLPRGRLREPVGGLRRAGVAVLTRTDQAPADEPADRQRDWLRRRFPELPVALAVHEPVELAGEGRTEPVDSLRGRTVGAFCGIGNPAAFRRTVESLGAAVAAFRPFPDHHPYTRADVDDLGRWAAGLPAGAWVLTTQKDWVKLRVADLGGRPLWAVRVGLRVTDGETDLAARLEAAVGGERGAA